MQEKEVYDKVLYNKLINYSILCQELKNLFLKLPYQAYDKNGYDNENFDNMNPELRKSCLFAPDQPQAVPQEVLDYQDQIDNPGHVGRKKKVVDKYEIGSEIFKYSGLF